MTLITVSYLYFFPFVSDQYTLHYTPLFQVITPLIHIIIMPLLHYPHIRGPESILAMAQPRVDSGPPTSEASRYHSFVSHYYTCFTLLSLFHAIVIVYAFGSHYYTFVSLYDICFISNYAFVSRKLHIRFTLLHLY